MIIQLDQHIDRVLARNEHCFLSAYSLSMKRVAAELDAMRAQLEIRKQEEALDERILELSKQLAWFQREAVLQEQENKRLKQALKNAKISKELVEEDKRFY